MTSPIAGAASPGEGHVLVAGGSGCLGAAVVATLTAAGHPVTATYRSHPPGDDEQADPGKVTWVRVDLTDPSEVGTAVAAVPDLAAVVNLAGGYSGGAPVHETSPDAFEHMWRLNLFPGFLLARASMPRLVDRGGGSFVAVSARAALRPFAGAAGYITAKAGVLALVQALDAEYGRREVRANAIVPSVIDTPSNRQAQPDADRSRWVQPDDIAAVVAFLVSDRSSAVRGAAIPV